jgi:hypothetical protein
LAVAGLKQECTLPAGDDVASVPDHHFEVIAAAGLIQAEVTQHDLSLKRAGHVNHDRDAHAFNDACLDASRGAGARWRFGYDTCDVVARTGVLRDGHCERDRNLHARGHGDAVNCEPDPACVAARHLARFGKGRAAAGRRHPLGCVEAKVKAGLTGCADDSLAGGGLARTERVNEVRARALSICRADAKCEPLPAHRGGQKGQGDGRKESCRGEEPGDW